MDRPRPVPKPPPKPDVEGTCVFLDEHGEMRRGAWGLRRTWLTATCEHGITSGPMGDCADPEAVASILLAAWVRGG